MEKVVVLMSTYNGEKYLDCQIRSIMSQTGVETLLLVRDDGSRDATIDMLRQYAAEYSSRIEVIKGENVGYAESFSILVEEALRRYPDVKYFAFADQDDYWRSEKLHRGVSHIMQTEGECGPECPISYASNTLLVDENLVPIRMAWRPERVEVSKGRALVQNYATGCTMVFNRAAARLYADTRPAQLGIHDFYMYQMCVYLGRFIWDAESRIDYRQHGNNQLGRPSLMGRMRNRIFGRKYLDHVLQRQAEGLLQAIGSRMADDDRKVVERFCNYNKGLNRLRLIFDRSISYDTLERDFFYRLKVLLGTV